MIFVVIPAFNDRATVLECLQCLQRQTFREFQVVLIDDGSTDGTADEVRRRHPETVILEGGGNLWWTGATALGVDYALVRSGDDDFVLALNNDLTFGADFLEALVEGSRRYPGAIVSAVVCDAGRRDRVLDAGQFFDGTTTQRPLRSGQEANLDVNVATGRGVLFPAAVFRKAGNYARRALPHYHADFEMALRAHRYGFYLVTYYPAKVYLRLDTTGFGESLFQKRTLRELWALAWSRKSVRDVRSTLAFLVIACPWRYTPRYVLKELVYAFWIYTGFTPLWHIRQPVEVLCKFLFPGWYEKHNVTKLYEGGEGEGA